MGPAGRGMGLQRCRERRVFSLAPPEVLQLFQKKPTGLLRLLLRLPIYVYRLELGWLLGHRFLLLTHRGRRTGLLHQTVLEVLKYDATTSESIVMAALGDRADWLRNIRHSPPLEVQTGRRCYVPMYSVLSEDEADRFLDEWERDHPLESAIGARVMGLQGGRWGGIKLVCFRPRDMGEASEEGPG